MLYRNEVLKKQNQMMTTSYQVQERIQPSPIESFCNFYLLANKRYRFHVVYSAMANLRFENIKILPKKTPKRKVLVPWLVTECKEPGYVEDVRAFTTPAHSPNARLELDHTDCREQFYRPAHNAINHIQSPESSPVSPGRTQLHNLPMHHTFEVVDAKVQSRNDSVSNEAATLTTQAETHIEAPNTVADSIAKSKDLSMDIDACSNQTSKQVMVGSLNEVDDNGISGSLLGSSTNKDGGNRCMQSNSTVPTDAAEGDTYATLPRVPITQKKKPIANESNLKTRRHRSFFSTLLRRNADTKNRQGKVRSSTLPPEAFGDRSGYSPLTNENLQPHRSSFLTRMSFASRSHTLSSDQSNYNVNSMVQKLSSYFDSDTELHMFIINFRNRAKSKKKRKGRRLVTDSQNDLYLSCRNTAALFREFYPQLKQIKKRRQKEVVNKLLGREHNCKDYVNERALIDALRCMQRCQ